MLNAYSSPEDAFAALDASSTNLNAVLDDNSLSLEKFVSGTRTFVPPLTEDQAKYAFGSLDTNHDKMLSSQEFLAVLRSGHFRRIPPGHLRQREGHSVSADPAPYPWLSLRYLAARDPQQAVAALADPHSRNEATWAECAAAGGSDEGNVPITMAAFKISMLNSYNSTEDVFGALRERSPVDLARFTNVTTTAFRPPLSAEQAKYAFNGLDADHDGTLTAFEFIAVLGFGHFFPTAAELEMMTSIAVADEDEGSSMAGTPSVLLPWVLSVALLGGVLVLLSLGVVLSWPPRDPGGASPFDGVARRVGSWIRLGSQDRAAALVKVCRHEAPRVQSRWAEKTQQSAKLYAEVLNEGLHVAEKANREEVPVPAG